MKVNVKINGKIETVEASADFLAKMMDVINTASKYNMAHGYSDVARDYERLYDDILEQTQHEILGIMEY